MKKFLFFVVTALLALAADDAIAQAPPTPAAPGVLAGYATLAATESSARVALPAVTVPYGAVTIYNNGSSDAYFKLGSSTVAATTSDTLIAAGKHLTLWATDAPTYLAAICDTGNSTSLGVYQSTGLLDFGP